jgi:hypothetical protein
VIFWYIFPYTIHIQEREIKEKKIDEEKKYYKIISQNYKHMASNKVGLDLDFFNYEASQTSWNKGFEGFFNYDTCFRIESW